MDKMSRKLFQQFLHENFQGRRQNNNTITEYLILSLNNFPSDDWSCSDGSDIQILQWRSWFRDNEENIFLNV